MTIHDYHAHKKSLAVIVVVGVIEMLHRNAIMFTTESTLN
jgi:hypothetical protein